MEFAVQIDLIIECGDADPVALTTRLGVDPTSAGRRGERNPNLNLPRVNYWSRRSHANDRDAPLAEHWASLAPLFAGKAEIIRAAGANGRNRLTVIVDATDRAPSVIIPPAMARFAALIDADIDVDIGQ